MSGLDTLIAKSFENALKNSLDERIVSKVQDRIYEKYGITISKAIEDFQKLDYVLKELFGTKTDVIEKQIFSKVVIVEGSKRNDRNWIAIEDPLLTKTILESVGDHDKKNILNSVLEEPRIISDILTMNHISQTSGYRKINSLIQSGILIPQGFAVMDDGKRVTRYRSVFENIVIKMEKNRVAIRVLPTVEAMAKSTVIRSVGPRFQYGTIHCT